LERAQSSDDEAVRRENFLIAYKENLILEKYFGLTLERSPYNWDVSQKRKLLKKIDPKTPYESPVSRGVWATVNEGLTWTIIVAILALLFFVNLYIQRLLKKGDRG
jgi:hypothetical protein